MKSNKRAQIGRGKAQQTRALDLDLDHPLGFVEQGARAELAAARVEHHLLQALNALDEAERHTRNPAYAHGKTIVMAVLQATVDDAIPLGSLRKLALRSAGLVVNVEPDGVTPGTVHERAGAKAQLLRLIELALEAYPSLSGSDDGTHLDFRRVAAAADSSQLDARPDVQEDATAVAATTIGALVFDARFRALHGATADPEVFRNQTARFARVVVELSNNDQASAVQIAKSALFLFGIQPKELKNFFVASVLDAAEEPIRQR